MPRRMSVSRKEREAFGKLTDKTKQNSRKPMSMSMDMSMGDSEEFGETGETDDAEEVDAQAFTSVAGVLDEIPEDGKLPDLSSSLEDGMKNNIVGKARHLLDYTGKKNSKKKDINNIVENSDLIAGEKRQKPDVGCRFMLRYYDDFITNCTAYINSRNPWTKIGKQRLAIVKALKYQAEWENNLIEKHGIPLAQANDHRSVTNDDLLELCRREVFFTNETQNKEYIETKASKEELEKGGDYVERRNKADAYAQELASRYRIDLEDAKYLSYNRKMIHNLDIYLGGSGLSKDLMKTLSEQIKYKKGKIDTSTDHSGRDTAQMEKAAARYKLNFGKAPDENTRHVARPFMIDGDSEEVQAQNEALFTKLAGKGKEEDNLEAWQNVFDYYTAFDLSKFDDRREQTIYSNFEELHRQSYLGFIYARHMVPGLHNAGFQVSKGQEGDMKALYDFYCMLHGFLEVVMLKYASQSSLLMDIQKSENYEDIINERTADQEGSFFERGSVDMEKITAQTKDYSWQSVAGALLGAHAKEGEAFYSNKKAIDILREDFGWKNEKDPKDMKVVLEKLQKKEK